MKINPQKHLHFLKALLLRLLLILHEARASMISVFLSAMAKRKDELGNCFTRHLLAKSTVIFNKTGQ
jgi:hypothetical protein